MPFISYLPKAECRKVKFLNVQNVISGIATHIAVEQG